MQKVSKTSDNSILACDKVFSILKILLKKYLVFSILNTFVILYFQLYFKYFYRRVLVGLLVFKILLKCIIYNTENRQRK